MSIVQECLDCFGRVPLLMSDIQALLTFCICGDRSTYRPHRFKHSISESSVSLSYLLNTCFMLSCRQTPQCLLIFFLILTFYNCYQVVQAGEVEPPFQHRLCRGGGTGRHWAWEAAGGAGLGDQQPQYDGGYESRQLRLQRRRGSCPHSNFFKVVGFMVIWEKTIFTIYDPLEFYFWR